MRISELFHHRLIAQSFAVALLALLMLPFPSVALGERAVHGQITTPNGNVGGVRRNFSQRYKAASAPAAAPALQYSSYLGGASADEGKSIALDKSGNIYVLGETFSEDFLGQKTPISGYTDLYVAKFNPAGDTLLYLTVFGSDDSDYALAVRVDEQSNAYVTGNVYAETFPTTEGALWAAPPESANGFLVKLDENGDIVYSTYLPLDLFDAKQNLAVDAAGNAYVTGAYPWVQTGDDYWGSQLALLKISADGSELLLDRNIGGHGSDKGTSIALDASGNIYLTGVTESRDDFPVTPGAHQPQCGDLVYDPDSYCFEDGVVVVMDAAGEVIYASFHGGSFSDEPQAIAADGKGNVVIAGNTTSGQFPVVNALKSECPIEPPNDDCFVPTGFVSSLRIVNGKGTLVYSTYLGSRERESNNAVYAAAMDSAGNAYVIGYTNGKHFPAQDAVQPQLYESFCTTFSSVRYCFDGFLAKFSPDGSLLFGTYLGAAYDDYPYGLAVDDAGHVYVAGTTEADDLPIAGDAFQPRDLVGDDAFLLKVSSGSSAAASATPETPEPPATPKIRVTPKARVTPAAPTAIPEPEETPDVRRRRWPSAAQ
jgi:hypothetical protein